VDGAKEHRILHIKTLEGKIKSISAWLKKAERKLALARKFYAKNKWQNSKTGCNFPIACSLQYKSTNWQSLRFQIHHKKRRLTLLTNRLKHLRVKPIKVFVLTVIFLLSALKTSLLAIKSPSGMGAE
jgi:hypothetical protein